MNKNYMLFLELGVQSLPEPEWSTALNSNSGPYFELVSLCKDLRKRQASFELSVEVRDAIFEQIRKVGNGSTAISQYLRENVAAIFGLIPKEHLSSI